MNNDLHKKFSNVFVLGDSLSDEGSLVNAISDIFNNLPIKNKKIINSAFLKKIKNLEEYKYSIELDDNHYNHSSFSDGPTAIRIVADYLGLDLKPSYCDADVNIFRSKSKIDEKNGNNYAIAGAVAQHYSPEILRNFSTLIQFANQPFLILIKKIFAHLNKQSTILEQTNWLIKQNKDKLDDALIFLSIGGNDILNLDLILAQKITGDHFNEALQYINESNKRIKESINDLISNGAKNIIVVNTCNATLLPRIQHRSLELKTTYHNLIINFNKRLLKDVNEINSNQKVCFLFDLYSCFNKIYHNALEQKMITNVGKYRRSYFHFDVDEESKVIHIVSKMKKHSDGDDFSVKKNEYLFWDSIHPSKWAHNETSKELIKFLNTIKFN